jgi:putative aldouronate transport system substrate-binding protein
MEKSFMKKITAMVVILAMLVSFAGCGKKSASDSNKTESGSSTGIDSPQGEATAMGTSDFYKDIDISKHADIFMYMVGTNNDLVDMDTILNKINERLEKELNATLHIEIIALGEYSVRYPLILSSGEDCDLIYTTSWLNFTENVEKNAFLELTDDFRNKYMPQTMKNEAADAWKEVAVKGKIFAVPRNQADFDSMGALAIRKDLREKYGIAPIKTFDDYENFLYTIAANEKKVYGLYSMNSWAPQAGYFYLSKNGMETTSAGDYFVYKSSADNTIDPKKIESYFKTQEYKDYVLKMAEWASKGVWPSNTIASSVLPTDQFSQGKSASTMTNPAGLQGLISDTIKNKVVASPDDIEIVDIFPNVKSRRSDYSNDSIAIPAFSKNPERAAMVLDMLKNDHELNMLMIGGIEGQHYVLDKTDNTRTPGSAAANYPWDTYTWGLRNSWNPTIKMYPQVKALQDDYTKRDKGTTPLTGFKFDYSSIGSKYSVISSLIPEYKFSFDLGVFGDKTKENLEKFINKLEDAGLEDEKDIYIDQVKTYISQN